MVRGLFKLNFEKFGIYGGYSGALFSRPMCFLFRITVLYTKDATSHSDPPPPSPSPPLAGAMSHLPRDLLLSNHTPPISVTSKHSLNISAGLLLLLEPAAQTPRRQLITNSQPTRVQIIHRSIRNPSKANEIRLFYVANDSARLPTAHPSFSRLRTVSVPATSSPPNPHVVEY